MINNEPDILDMSLSKFEIFRTETVEITIIAEDLETVLSTMTCDLEVKHPGSDTWVKLDQPQLSNESRVSQYAPSTDAPLGYYSFRASVADDETSPGKSTPMVLLDILLVKNNPSSVLNLSVESKEVYRLKEVEVYAQAEDIEDPQDKLDGIVEYRYNGSGGLKWTELSSLSYRIDDTSGFWITSFKPQKDAELGSSSPG